MDFWKIISKNKWIIAIFIIAFIIRLIFIFSMPTKLWDETIYLNLGYDLSKNPLDYSFSNGWGDFMPSGGDENYSYPKAGFRAPILPYLLSLFYFFRLNFLIPIIIPLIGALSVILIYILGKEVFNKRIGIISALFLTFIPLHVFYSTRILTEVLFTFFILLTFIYFWKGYEKEDKKSKILFGVFLGLSLLSRYTALWIIPIFLIYFLIRDKSLKFLKDKYLWYSILAFFLILLPWLIYGIFEYTNPIGAFIHGFKAAAYWGGQQNWSFFFTNWLKMFSVIGIIFIFVLVYILYKKEFLKKEIYLFLTWFILFLGISICMPHKEDRFIIPLIPPLVILSSYFIDKIKKYKEIIIAILIILLIFSLEINFYNTHRTYNNINVRCLEEVGEKLKEIQGEFIIVSENPPLFRYYTKQENAYYPDKLNEETIRNFEDSKDKPIYFVFVRFNSGFETEKWKNLKEIMQENYTLLFECAKDKEVNWIYSNVH
ncbi:MAG: ArnT family glycosyltransferase [Nanobdellota archaeon]